jgi:hypothetical protein
MHGPINVKSPNNTSKWQMGFTSAFKGLITPSPRGSAFSSVRWESKILRKGDGPASENGCLRIKVKQGNYNRFKSPDI